MGRVDLFTGTVCRTYKIYIEIFIRRVEISESERVPGLYCVEDAAVVRFGDIRNA